MRICKAVVFYGVFFLVSVVHAYTPREGNVNVNIGPFFSKTRFDDPRSSADGGMSSFGLVTVGDINVKGALEIGIFHFNKSFFRDQGPYFVAEKTEILHITMGYRWWLSSSWSSSLTFSSSYTMGTPGTLFNNFPIDEQIPTSAQDTVEYGLDCAIQRELWAQGPYGLVLDLRYGLSLTSKTREQGDHYGALISLRYLVQEKYPSNLKKDQHPGKN